MKLHSLDETDDRIAVAGGFGIGAPGAIVVLEGLIVQGIRRFLSIGTAGSLQRHLAIGDIVVCDRAIRDEGTSHHYLPPDTYAHASPAATARLVDALQATGTPHSVGTSWTTDAPYRETIAEVQHYQAEGVLAVEMEAAALFAVAAYRGVEMGSLLTISDTLGDLKWDPHFRSDTTRESLETALPRGGTSAAIGLSIEAYPDRSNARVPSLRLALESRARGEDGFPFSRE